jgi:hypothetical protein
LWQVVILDAEQQKARSRSARQRAWVPILLGVFYFAAPDTAAVALCAWW